MEEKGARKKLTTQTKLVFGGMAVSTLVMALLGTWATVEIEQALSQGYHNFATIIAKTLAIESEEIIKDIPTTEKYEILRNHSKSILKNNSDISYVEFLDNEHKIIYSSKQDFPKKYEKNAMIASSALKITEFGQSEVVGSVMVGLSSSTLAKINKTTQLTMIGIFLLAWFVIAGIVFANTSIIASELRKLYNGVKRISSGEFGYTIDKENAGQEVCELFDAFN